MTTACWHETALGISERRRPMTTLAAWHLSSAALVVGLVFFVTEHNLNLSLAEAYTQTMDEMELTAQGGNLLRRLAFFILAGQGLWLLVAAKEQLRINQWLAIPIACYL